MKTTKFSPVPFRFDESRRIADFEKEERKHSLPKLVDFLEKTAIPFMLKHGRVTRKKQIFAKNVNWFKTKNYDWIVVDYQNTRSLVRKYRYHLTVYTIRTALNENEDNSLRITMVEAPPVDDGDEDITEDSTATLLRELLTRLAEQDRVPFSASFKEVMSFAYRFLSEMHAKNPKYYWFALEELSTLNLYICERHLQAVAYAYPDLKFKIPYEGGGFLTGFGESNGQYYLTIEGNRDKKTCVDFWGVQHFGPDLENLLKLFEWLDLKP